MLTCTDTDTDTDWCAILIITKLAPDSLSRVGVRELARSPTLSRLHALLRKESHQQRKESKCRPSLLERPEPPVPSEGPKPTMIPADLQTVFRFQHEKKRNLLEDCTEAGFDTGVDQPHSSTTFVSSRSRERVRVGSIGSVCNYHHRRTELNYSVEEIIESGQKEPGPTTLGC